MQRTLRNRVPGAAAAIAVVTTLASSALIADAQTADASGDEVGAQALPTSYQWESTGPLIGPQPDPTHNVVSAKDPTAVRHNNEWIVYPTIGSYRSETTISEFPLWSASC
jgi:endo-1,4-beta-xylanase